MFDSAFFWIFAVGIVTAFLKGRNIDRCLKDFNSSVVTAFFVGGKKLWGKYRVESTGCEFRYKEPHQDSDGHIENSYLMYKTEWVGVQAFVRFHDDLSSRGKRARAKDLKRAYKPGLWRRLKRKVRNMVSILKDALMEGLNMLIGQHKSKMGGGDKSLKKMNKDLISSSASYEPLLEKYIGHKVVVDVAEGETSVEYVGVLKEYTSEFVSVMDVAFAGTKKKPRVADIVWPRSRAVVRHLGE